jgi:hypothetical protein
MLVSVRLPQRRRKSGDTVARFVVCLKVQSAASLGFGRCGDDADHGEDHRARLVRPALVLMAPAAAMRAGNQGALVRNAWTTTVG